MPRKCCAPLTACQGHKKKRRVRLGKVGQVAPFVFFIIPGKLAVKGQGFARWHLLLSPCPRRDAQGLIWDGSGLEQSFYRVKTLVVFSVLRVLLLASFFQRVGSPVLPSIHHRNAPSVVFFPAALHRALQP